MPYSNKHLLAYFSNRCLLQGYKYGYHNKVMFEQSKKAKSITNCYPLFYKVAYPSSCISNSLLRPIFEIDLSQFYLWIFHVLGDASIDCIFQSVHLTKLAFLHHQKSKTGKTMPVPVRGFHRYYACV